ncbi:SLBB domain-containing protein [Leuconostoc citreum]|uniref:SLBB domain-containing protein n=1 Tax=Leuconostoc citreum TaxID=33964 RepID=UPI0031343C9F
MIDQILAIKEKILAYRFIKWVICGIMLILVLGIYAIYMLSHQHQQELTSVKTDPSKEARKATMTNASTEIKSQSSDAVIMVDVKGAVKRPGVYNVVDNPRAQKAIAQAGGITSEADITTVNLAQKMSDGTVIYVPNKNEPQPNNERTVIAKKSDSAKINLNTATANELQMLEGIGAKKQSKLLRIEKHMDILRM